MRLIKLKFQYLPMAGCCDKRHGQPQYQLLQKLHDEQLLQEFQLPPQILNKGLIMCSRLFCTFIILPERQEYIFLGNLFERPRRILSPSG